jgi:hypothetical protein
MGTPVSLSPAREAFHSGAYSDALKHFEYFFDHALDENPYAKYGVRLSFCLAGWAKLGDVYPPAKQRLEERCDEALVLLEQTREPERFHDYMAICHYLGRDEQCVPRFLHYHVNDRALAETFVRYIWDGLVDAKQWQVCASYLEDPLQRYQDVMAKAAQIMEMRRQDPTFGGVEFEEQSKGWCVRDISNLLLVAKHAGMLEAESRIYESLPSDLESIGCPELLGRIHERASH